MDPDLQTASLHALVARHRGGDGHALDDLIRRTGARLEHLASRMLRDYPAVRDNAQTVDVLQSAYIRLIRALKEVTPDSVRGFYRLAAEQVRRELHDLARHHRRRPADRLGDADPAAGPADAAAGLDRWAALQEAVDTLPADQREVFGLTFYHGWTQARIADLLQVSDRQVRRLWKDACLGLDRAVNGDLPEF